MDRFELGPIFRALTRTRTGAILIALQIAVTMTVVVNSWFMIAERLALVERPSGMVEEEIFSIHSTGFTSDFDNKESIDADLRLLRETPGIRNAYVTNAVPLAGSGWSTGLQLQPEAEAQAFSTAVYLTDEHTLDTLGVELVAGVNFDSVEITWREPAQADWPDKTILTRTLAEAMFPDQPLEAMLGQTVYSANNPITIIGIVEKLQSPWTGWSNIEHVMLLPQRNASDTVAYMVRTEPGVQAQMMPVVEEALASSNDQRILRNLSSMQEHRERSYALDSGLANILIYVIVFLVVITSVGILGLASFSVSRRTKQIGIRRALGATRTDVLRYFLLENLLITSVGVLLGAALTMALNIALVDALNFPKIHWASVPIGMLVLLLLGQLAVLGPARRASNIAPAVATRTV